MARGARTTTEADSLHGLPATALAIVFVDTPSAAEIQDLASQKRERRTLRSYVLGGVSAHQCSFNAGIAKLAK
jgi:hypothetical protein